MSDRRTQIVAAARELLGENAERALSVRSVAARAGVGASTLRHYFPTQRELYRAVFDTAYDETARDLRIDDPDVPAVDRLVECLAQLLPPHLPFETWVVVLSGMVGSDSTADSRLAWTSFVERSRVRVVDWLTRLEQEGAVAPGPVERRARLLLVVVDGLSIGRMLQGHRAEQEELDVLRDAVEAIVTG
ncbi:TetR/AcrR family transcriptional regulator [Cryptosporangium japonicum]|uniref:HTH tetR-type domain-containing protein n=1 Tax=Cryptosporangium japonicum TaxID=80872 RepID=A0ABP3DC34_9ACTN